ncbi:MAG: hypothetical protein QOK25_2868 [Thermoleophilaceae bacterium]|nr:hypothetical protein [Thermoleophilaceae bacterium]
MRHTRNRTLVTAGAVALAIVAAVQSAPAAPSTTAQRGVHSARVRVLRVGKWHGVSGQYKTIQAAANAAKPGDWILVGPGDYHERADHALSGRPNATTSGGAVYLTKSGVHLRGMDRNRVVVDGAKPGTGRCPAGESAQDFGPLGKDGKSLGRNGVEVWKASGVSVENLTACNFLDGNGGGGNQIWFNGGDGSGKIGMGAFRGAYLSATTTFFKTGAPAGSYGIFSSNTRGPGIFTQSYASNMDDSSFYVGACRPDCNQVLDHVHAQGSTLGLSSTNVGGRVSIQNSEWDRNKTGLVTNSQNNDDAPEPQDGSCVNGGTGPTGTHSCTIWRNNYVHDNNNADVPQSGTAGEGPVGTGMVIAGGRYDTIIGNRVVHNGSWGILLVPFPDIGHPPAVAHCRGGVQTQTPDGQTECVFDDWGNEVRSNTLSQNGFFGNPSNSDLAEISNLENPGNCWHDNVRPAAEGAVTSDPPAIQQTHGTCGQPNSGNPLTSPLGAEVACATQLLADCPKAPGATYPRLSTVKLLPLPKQTSMSNPCKNVPSNPWCSPKHAKRPRDPDHDGDHDLPGQK